ncbi:MAG: LysR family transcriptional regulator [Pseudomonadota bacterium]
MDVIEQLRTLLAVADAESFTRAGEQMGKSKALVSKHISDLEDRLDARLLNRTTRKVSPTVVGAAFLDRARVLVEDFDALVDSVRDEARVQKGRLRITAPQAFGELEVMELICAFRLAHPKIEPHVFLSDRNVDLVAEGFDVALRVAPLVDSSMIVRKLCDVDMCICASPDYLEKNGKPAEPGDLANHRCVTDGNMQASHLWRFKSAKPPSVQVRSILQVNSAAATRQAALASLGIAAIPEFVVGQDIKSGALVELFKGQTDYNLKLHMLYPHRQHLSGRTRAFIDFAAKWYGATRPWHR